jgi:glycosyltransferase involved in cell wall biosynthesis
MSRNIGWSRRVLNGRRRVLSIAHSYVVALNRGLPNELAKTGGKEWEVTAVAPSVFHGDLRLIPLEPSPAEGCTLEAVPVRMSRYIHVMSYGARLRDLLTRPWDLVHCWEEPYILAGAQVAWWTQAGVPLVYASFQNISKAYVPPFNWLEAYSINRASGWIASGRTIEQTLLQRAHYKDRKRRVIPMGVDVQAFRPDAAAGLAIRQSLGWEGPSPPVIGYLGRFVPEKGVKLLTAALDRLQSDWLALFVGGGPLENGLRKWAAAYPGRVRILTGVTHDRVPAYLNAMDVLCAPSQTTSRWREQFGRMLIEAFACGRAVVASDSGEIPFVVGDAGVTVGESDVEAWTKSLEELLNSPERRRDLGGRGLERAHRHYSWPVVASQYLEFFEEILSQ